jgi:hypothetical protein
MKILELPPPVHELLRHDLAKAWYRREATGLYVRGSLNAVACEYIVPPTDKTIELVTERGVEPTSGE